jgi:hypothetical protein
MAREDPTSSTRRSGPTSTSCAVALDLLVPGGIGVFLVPAGFMSGNTTRAAREKLLRRHHLLGAFRLPSHDVKGRDTVPARRS